MEVPQKHTALRQVPSGEKKGSARVPVAQNVGWIFHGCWSQYNFWDVDTAQGARKSHPSCIMVVNSVAGLFSNSAPKGVLQDLEWCSETQQKHSTFLSTGCCL